MKHKKSFFKSTSKFDLPKEYYEDPTEAFDRLAEFSQNPKTDQFKNIVDDLLFIYMNKNHDYGDSFGDTFKKLGIVSAVTRITDKTNRLISLSTKEAKVNDESIEDTLMDLANYAIMTLIELRGESDE